MLVAVTSTDGTIIDQHFGKAERFLVYEVGTGEAQLVSEVKADPYCGWSAQLLSASTPEEAQATIDKMQECADAVPAHSMMPDKLASIARALANCRIIVTAMIGEAPREEMERLGFDIYTMTGPLQPSLAELSKLL